MFRWERRQVWLHSQSVSANDEQCKVKVRLRAITITAAFANRAAYEDKNRNGKTKTHRQSEIEKKQIRLEKVNSAQSAQSFSSLIWPRRQEHSIFSFQVSPLQAKFSTKLFLMRGVIWNSTAFASCLCIKQQLQRQLATMKRRQKFSISSLLV